MISGGVVTPVKFKDSGLLKFKWIFASYLKLQYFNPLLDGQCYITQHHFSKHFKNVSSTKNDSSSFSENRSALKLSLSQRYNADLRSLSAEEVRTREATL